jgi:hypothetical protein
VKMVIWVICEGLTLKPLDIALSIGQARKRSMDYISEPHEGIYFTINNRGNMAAYSENGENVYVQIVQYEANCWGVITKWSDDLEVIP